MAEARLAGVAKTKVVLTLTHDEAVVLHAITGGMTLALELKLAKDFPEAAEIIKSRKPCSYDADQTQMIYDELSVALKYEQ